MESSPLKGPTIPLAFPKLLIYRGQYTYMLQRTVVMREHGRPGVASILCCTPGEKCVADPEYSGGARGAQNAEIFAWSCAARGHQYKRALTPWQCDLQNCIADRHSHLYSSLAGYAATYVSFRRRCTRTCSHSNRTARSPRNLRRARLRQVISSTPLPTPQSGELIGSPILTRTSIGPRKARPDDRRCDRFERWGRPILQETRFGRSSA